MKYILGIDGGGTKTKYILSDDKGHIISEHTGPTIHYLQVGLGGLKDNLIEGISTLIQPHGIDEKDIIGAFVGTPGYGDISEDTKILQDTIKEALKDIPHTIGNDTDNAHAGSLGLNPGIVVIAGTGSIGLGINEKDEHLISGGWHQSFGGDEGSAHWIAEKYIQEFTKQSDLRKPKTQLYTYMKDKHQFKDDSYALKKFVVDWDYDRTKIASLSVDVYELAKLNDVAALEIFDQAAYEISSIYRAIFNHLTFDHYPVKLSYVGGVFKSDSYIFDPLHKYLKDLNVEIIKPKLTPDLGSVLLGFKIANIEVTDSILNNLSKSL